jgi:hypothetical protein
MNVPQYHFRNLEAPLYQRITATHSEVHSCYRRFTKGSYIVIRYLEYRNTPREATGSFICANTFRCGRKQCFDMDCTRRLNCAVTRIQGQASRPRPSTDDLREFFIRGIISDLGSIHVRLRKILHSNILEVFQEICNHESGHGEEGLARIYNGYSLRSLHSEMKRLFDNCDEGVILFMSKRQGWQLNEDILNIVDGLGCNREDKEEKKQNIPEVWRKANASRLVYPRLSGIYGTMRETDG